MVVRRIRIVLVNKAAIAIEAIDAVSLSHVVKDLGMPQRSAAPVARNALRFNDDHFRGVDGDGAFGHGSSG